MAAGAMRTWTRTRPRGVSALGVLLLHGVCSVAPMDIRASPEVRAFLGEDVVLSCTFRSSAPLTEKLTVDWTYRPRAGGGLETIFHYQSVPYPAEMGTFKGRISWVGDVAKGDASIAIQNPMLIDNGTFSCAVKNPPDVHHNIPWTVLTVTERGLSFQLTSAMLLSIVVFIPSVVVVILLLVRMGRKFGLLKNRKKSGYKKSSIEVSDEPEHSERDGCMRRLGIWCLQCVDSDDEDPY
ncbi:PREDICTED: myelin protein zero-like protein 3 [Crocodylus porosus]|uniref:Myelin protein zero like 3 n=1 Tax=Crocodylus porosus TaxID=8502 RepID=A0A7M4DV82_CROPO|nr:PREDICTED: myelin protein zero-like protein 3 [Crocodylus porosus]